MFRSSLAGIAASLAIAAGTASALGQVGTAFTYQGQLKNAGSNVNSATDMQFSLWTAASGGTQVGSTITQADVPVAQGVFTTTVDFGVSPYTNGQALWLQIAVRNPAGTGAYVPMGSRQQLTAAPFSLATRGLNVDASGNVGIGTPTPNRPLHVQGNGAVIAVERNAPDATLSLARFATGGTFTTANEWKRFNISTTGTGTNAGSLNFNDDQRNTVSGGQQLTRMMIDSAGRVGIGTTTPGALLEVAYTPGAINDPAALFRVGNCGVPCGQEDWQEGIRLLNENGNGRVGLGFLSATGATIDTVPDAWIGTGDGFLGNGSHLYIATKSGGALTTRMFVNGSNGNVGIGTTTPGSKLSFANFVGTSVPTVTLFENTSGGDRYGLGMEAGAMNFWAGDAIKAKVRNDGVFEVKTLQINGGSDLVEGFDSPAKDIEPGTLMVIDPEHPGQLMPSASAYDTRVAGVVSGAGGINPGIHMGQSGTIDGKNPIAMTGRVYVKCTAAGGAIQPGDLLTTSDVAGYAMKASDRSRAPGAVIGKAMSSLDKDTGLVLVLVNLQ
ncbi:MAG TPA: hypothetical protein VHC70_14300 [Phycisphaerales bacterium]|nr:hypothetical protein [Phycisphaerales bacterium]